MLPDFFHFVKRVPETSRLQAFRCNPTFNQDPLFDPKFYFQSLSPIFGKILRACCQCFVGGPGCGLLIPVFCLEGPCYLKHVLFHASTHDACYTKHISFRACKHVACYGFFFLHAMQNAPFSALADLQTWGMLRNAQILNNFEYCRI